MANILDYVVWRGDLPFTKSKLNYVDIAILSQIVMLDLKGIVPYKTSKPLYECAEKYFSHSPKHKYLGYIIPSSINDLFELLAKSERFSSLELSRYKEDIELESETQFSAITIDASEIKTKFIIFSGTDDTIVCWKENFNLVYKTPTEAQIQSVKYLNKACDGFDGKIIVLGHSKGGHLAIYSSANCKSEIRENIKKIYNLDGPGIPDCAEAENVYKIVEKKLISILPQFSIIGRLFEQGGKHVIVHSSATGFNQHDCFSWQVTGCKFTLESEFEPNAVGVENCIRKTLAELSPPQRESFVETLFKLLYSSGAKTLTELAKRSKKLLPNYLKLSKEERSSLNAPMIKLLSDKYLRKCILESSKEFNKTKNAKKTSKN